MRNFFDFSRHSFSHEFAVETMIVNFIGIVNAISKTIYVGTDKKLQFLNKIIGIGIIKITPIGVTLPMCVVSIFKYFTTDLGDEAFDLPFHQW